jgi:hypothetical protein
MYIYKYYIVFNLQTNVLRWSVRKKLGAPSKYWGTNCVQARSEVEVSARLRPKNLFNPYIAFVPIIGAKLSY